VKTLLVRVQSEQARSAADKIGQFVSAIEAPMAAEMQLPRSTRTADEWRVDAARLLRQVPALTEIAQIDGRGRERYRTSRQSMDFIDSFRDYSHDPAFTGAKAGKVYYGPVYFVQQSEPYMTLAVAGPERDDGVVVGQVNLKFIWDVVSKIKVGAHGQAYVVDAQGRLIADPDISLVLRHIDLSQLDYVRKALAPASPDPADTSSVVTDLRGREVLSAYAKVAPLGWVVFAEMPIDEAYAPLYRMVLRSALLLAAGLVFAFAAGLLLARRMVVPIRKLSEGAARIGGGDLRQRITIRTGDELEALGNQFNSMAARLRDSYATLERKVEERTRQLEAANLAKSRFLAAASHDLRQPLHALGLFIAQLRGRPRADERKRIMTQVDAALSAMNELFNALLDVSRLDAGALTPDMTAFPVSQLLKRIETTFADAAREKGLSLRIVPSSAWVRSDFILLERVLGNLVSNAIRYTRAGGVLVGCRRKGGRLRIDVCDTGAGIPEDQQQQVFVEFCRLGEHERDHRGGLGLGLAIVERLCRLLGHRIELASRVGSGSRFSVEIPVADSVARIVPQPVAEPRRLDISSGKLVAVIDDDPMVLEGMGGLLRSWGCRVVTGASDDEVLAGLAAYDDPPDVIISDYQLRGGRTGVQAIARLCESQSAPIAAFLMSGDTNPEPLEDAQKNGYVLLHKPVDPMALRATFTQVIRKRRPAPVEVQ
jgi:signal transduction histidine kinase/CheY-like chemotaxis protein